MRQLGHKDTQAIADAHLYRVARLPDHTCDWNTLTMPGNRIPLIITH